jgi:Holliday junction resolvasome RuvABC DNA-binding subunit
VEIARLLSRVADLLEAQDANPFRVGSYRRVAEELRAPRSSAATLYAEGGGRRLQEIPGVGRALSSAIEEILETGGLRLLERLEAAESPPDAFGRLPGVGPKLARRIHDELGVTTLEELELAAHDGRLLAVEGIGEKRARGIRDVLAARLARSYRLPPHEPEPERRPSVALLLEVDREYRRRARLGELRRIAPKRFNPEHEAWLPIMEVEREGWDFTALFSNTQRAHELGRTRDWVVIYYHRDGDAGQCTVVTARTGRLRELRVVRGREPECRHLYAEVRKIA